ncbi:ANTAR domain-containing protein [Knoellia aerolata]|uniref:ANTAR domain-containing protein n=1 Tax=Knoellia aerolata DSM 18566 TaxID=1385519 RepID=A0A0A0JU90_9MICO|nr:ANTAR domain-containing protein [Knoellia aerolata]KGN40708.1 hypothetical protein N801_12810 [Knoellia aerolata DSM 18566]
MVAKQPRIEDEAHEPDLDTLRERADEAEVRASASDERAGAQNARVDRLEERVDIHEELIAELQAEGSLSRKHAANLEQALRSARLIGSAVGIVMANRRVSEDVAFRTLGRASQNTNVKLRLVAEEVVRTGDVSPLPEL